MFQMTRKEKPYSLWSLIKFNALLFVGFLGLLVIDKVLYSVFDEQYVLLDALSYALTPFCVLMGGLLVILTIFEAATYTFSDK